MFWRGELVWWFEMEYGENISDVVDLRSDTDVTAE